MAVVAASAVAGWEVAAASVEAVASAVAASVAVVALVVAAWRWWLVVVAFRGGGSRGGAAFWRRLRGGPGLGRFRGFVGLGRRGGGGWGGWVAAGPVGILVGLQCLGPGSHSPAMTPAMVIQPVIQQSSECDGGLSPQAPASKTIIVDRAGGSVLASLTVRPGLSLRSGRLRLLPRR